MSRQQQEEAEFAAQLERALQLSLADQVWQVSDLCAFALIIVIA